MRARTRLANTNHLVGIASRFMPTHQCPGILPRSDGLRAVIAASPHADDFVDRHLAETLEPLGIFAISALEGMLHNRSKATRHGLRVGGSVRRKHGFDSPTGFDSEASFPRLPFEGLAAPV